MASRELKQPEPLTSKVTSWLTTQGYPLEMRVARALQLVGAHVIQSDYYVDQVTGVAREIDVVATWDHGIGDLIIRVNFTIECKGTKHKPWVMFVSGQQRLASPARVAQRAASQLGRLALLNMADDQSVQDLLLFRLPRFCGYSIAPMQEKNNEKDECFAAMNGVAASTAAQAAQPDYQVWQSGTTEVLEIIFPVIVTDAPLCTAMLDQNSELVVEEAKQGVVMWRNPVVGLPNTLVHIVTAQEFNNFAEDMAESVGIFLKMCSGPLRYHIDNALVKTRQARVLRSNPRGKDSLL